MAAETENIHEDIRELRVMMTANLEKTTQIYAVMFPAPGQPNAIQALGNRVSKLENWRSMLGGAWAVVTAAFGYHMVGKH